MIIEIAIAFGRLVGWQVPKSCNPCNPYWLLYCNEVTASGSQIDTFQTTRTVLFVATNPTFYVNGDDLNFESNFCPEDQIDLIGGGTLCMARNWT